MVEEQNQIFLVEDNPDDEALTIRAIKSVQKSCNVTVMRHGSEALSFMISRFGPSPRLIILDYNLPGLSGLDILQRLRRQERTRDVPIVFLSALESDREITSCLRAGANSFVRKAPNAREYSENVATMVRYWLSVDSRPAVPPPNPRLEAIRTKARVKMSYEGGSPVAIMTQKNRELSAADNAGSTGDAV